MNGTITFNWPPLLLILIGVFGMGIGVGMIVSGLLTKDLAHCLSTELEQHDRCYPRS